MSGAHIVRPGRADPPTSAARPAHQPQDDGYTWHCVDCEHRLTSEAVANRHLYELGHVVIGDPSPPPRRGRRR